MMQKRYAVVLERAERNWSAYVPDVDGCISTGKTAAETLRNIQEALQAHLDWMGKDGDPIPEPTSAVDYVDIEIRERVKGVA